MRFLIDECLTTALIPVANQRGHDAQHVALIGKAGWQDWSVTQYAVAGDFIVVTNNVSDFLKLYAGQELHPGLVILLPSVDRETQKRLFAATLIRLSVVGEPVNQVVEVSLDGQDITVDIYPLSDSSS
jgi:predicted nuclease of predicted toxin-antitoxin system